MKAKLNPGCIRRVHPTGGGSIQFPASGLPNARGVPGLARMAPSWWTSLAAHLLPLPTRRIPTPEPPRLFQAGFRFVTTPKST